MDWNDDTIAALRQMWLEGMSASQVARQLGGGVSRNAVIGKIHRLGLSGREAPSRPRSLGGRPPGKATVRPTASSVPRPVPQRPVKVAAPPAPEPFCEAKPSATILTLGEHACRWPIGDPDQGDFGFCGARRPGRGPYCEGHSSVSLRKKLKPITAQSLEKWLGGRPVVQRPSSLREALY
jgi:GcrA cell cycle regulator